MGKSYTRLFYDVNKHFVLMWLLIIISKMGSWQPSHLSNFFCNFLLIELTFNRSAEEKRKYPLVYSVITY